MKLKVLSVVSALLLFAEGTVAQAPNCGDANGDGQADIADVTYTIEYFFNGGPPPVDFDTTDQDRKLFLSIQDLNWMLRCAFSCDIPGDCSPVAPPIAPAPDARVEFNYENVIPAGSATYGLRIGMGGIDVSLESFLAPLKITVDGAPATIDSVVFDESLPQSIFGISDIRGPGSAIVALASLFPPTWDASALGEIFISVSPSTIAQQVEMSWDTLSPIQAPVSQLNSQYPLFNTTDFGIGNSGDYVPALVGTCCWVPGDYNHDRSYNIGDVIDGIARIFSGGAAPPCPQEADFFDDDSFNMFDITKGIDYIFRGGAPPAPCLP